MPRNRIKELIEVRAGDLKPDPRNWRLHPEYQKRALASVRERVGHVAPVLVRKTRRGYVLVDGHLRAGMDPEELIPAVVLDVKEDEAGEVLATFDSIGSMAETDSKALTELLESVDIEDEGMLSHLNDIVAEGHGGYNEDVTENTDEDVDEDIETTYKVAAPKDIAGEVFDAVFAAVQKFEGVTVR